MNGVYYAFWTERGVMKRDNFSINVSALIPLTLYW